MKRKHVLLIAFVAFASMAILVSSCKKEEEPAALSLVSLVAGEIDLNAAVSPSNVPVDPTLVATFNVDVDVATAVAANITLLQDYDNTDISLNISASGKTITITPAVNLGTGTLHKLTFGAGLKSTDGEALTELTRNFTTEGSFAPSGAIAHWTFEDNANDVVGNYNPTANGVVGITYTASRNAAAGKAATFDGDVSIIEIPNGDQLINTQSFTISFWVKTNSAGHETGHFVLGLGAFYGIQYEIFGNYEGAKFAIQYELANGETVSEDMWFPSEATDNTTGGWQGWEYAKSLTPAEMIALLKDNWLHVVYTYNGEAKRGILYYNGERMKSFNFNLWPDEDPKRTVVGMKYAGSEPDVVNELAFGFIHSRAGTMWDTEPWGGYDFPDANHFKGQLDDIRIFHKALTLSEVSLMYNSEKP